MKTFSKQITNNESLAEGMIGITDSLSTFFLDYYTLSSDQVNMSLSSHIVRY